MINEWLSFSREVGRHSDLRRSDLDLIGAYVLIVPREKWTRKRNRKMDRKLIGKTPAADALGSPRRSPLGRENVSPFSRASDENLARTIWKVFPIKDTHSTKTDTWFHWIYPSPNNYTIDFQISQWQKVTIQEPYHTYRKYFIFSIVIY